MSWKQGRRNAEQQWQSASNMMLERALQSLSSLLTLKVVHVGEGGRAAFFLVKI
jgi:hypothetical protein